MQLVSTMSELVGESITSYVEMSLALTHGSLEAVDHHQKGYELLCEEYADTSLLVEGEEGIEKD